MYLTLCLQDPIVSIAPKKPNWDLRRDVAKKLEKLERRTQRAIVELMSKYPEFERDLYLNVTWEHCGLVSLDEEYLVCL